MFEDFELTPRVVVAIVAFLVSTLLVLFTQPNTEQQRRSALRGCAEQLQKVLAERSMHALFLRLACSDAFSCDQFRENGANGSIHFEEELARPQNAGLSEAVEVLAGIKKRYPAAALSWADLIQLAAVVAVRSAGGPSLNLKYGRVDAKTPSKEATGLELTPPFSDGAPDAGTHIRNLMFRLGLSSQEMAALIGGLRTIGRVYKDKSGALGYTPNSVCTKHTAAGVQRQFDGTPGNYLPGGATWTEDWLVFNHSYFRRPLTADDSELVWLPTDQALASDPEFKPHFELFARDQGAFFRDFAEAFRKISEVGVRFQPPEGVQL